MRVRDPSSSSGAGIQQRLFLSMASRPSATLALCWTTTPDAASWGPPLMYHVGEKVAPLPTETNPMSPSLSSRDPSKNRPWAMPEIVRTVSKILEPTWQGRKTSGNCESLKCLVRQRMGDTGFVRRTELAFVARKLFRRNWGVPVSCDIFPALTGQLLVSPSPCLLVSFRPGP